MSGKLKSGILQAICICPVKSEPMQKVEQVQAIAGRGLEGDRYCEGHGSFSGDKPEERQVSLMNALFFKGSGFEFTDSRRNLFLFDVEVNRLIGRKFTIGEVVFGGVKYCFPCERPKMLSGKETSFAEAFWDRGGIIAEVLSGGVIKVNDPVVMLKEIK